MSIYTAITHEALTFDLAQKFISGKSSGAQIFFAGTVRDHNLGKKVRSLEYSAYEPMAEKLLAKMAEKTLEQFKVEKIYMVHRLGHLALEDISILIAVSSAHRDETYKASRFLIEQVKHHLPVWKKEHYVDEDALWVRCTDHEHKEHAHDDH